jgi:sugar O-acyltransferase (sialic acid O-acetyltransferase NeuD family)
MVQDLIIVGAGGTSRYIAWAVDELNRVRPTWRLRGFLDDDAAKKGLDVDGYPVLGPIDSVAEYLSCRFVVGIATDKNPLARELVVRRLGLEPDRFPALIHPSAAVSPHAEVGPGAVVLNQAVVQPGVVLGRHVIVSPLCVLGHGACAEDYVTIATSATVSGSVRLGRGVYVGARSVILPGLQIGEAAIAGIGSVVVKDVSAGTTVFGNPARPLPRTRRAMS